MSSILSFLWNSYLDYLWNYDSNSWVAAIAYAFRIWAILAILPTLVLALLDVTSYVIARTLGDPTASTSHKSSFATQLPPNPNSKIINARRPTTVLADPGPDPADPVAVAALPPGDESPSKPTAVSTAASVTGAFFVTGEEGSEDDGAARLAGVGVFSPVASMPGSPTVSRRNLFEKEGEEDGGGRSGSYSSSNSDGSGLPFAASRGVLLSSGVGGVGVSVSVSGTIHHQQQHQYQHQHHHQHHQGGREAEEAEHERGHGHGHSRSASDGGDGGGGGGGANDGGSTSGESSFAMLDREESFEDDAGVHIRRRVPGASAVDE